MSKTRRQIGLIAYQKKMTKHERSFDLLWVKMVKDTNDHISKYGTYSDYNMVESLVDSLALSGSWLADRLRGYMGTPHHHTYKNSLAKKIRKALGYNL